MINHVLSFITEHIAWLIAGALIVFVTITTGIEYYQRWKNKE